MIDQLAQWSGAERAAAESLIAGGWTLHPWMAGDDMACIAIMHGPEIHFVAAPKWRRRLILRERTRAFLAPLMEKHGYLTTRADPEDGHRGFLERLGFVFTWNDGQMDHFMMHELPFEHASNQASELTPVSAEATPESEPTGIELSKRLGIGTATVCRVRKGKAVATLLGGSPSA